MNTENRIDRRWNMRQRDWAVVFWIAFLSAAASAFVLFGLINPLDMVNAWAGQYDIGVRLAYGLAFAFLYLVSLLASALTVFMIRTGPQRGHVKGKARRPKAEIHHHAEGNPDLDKEDWP
jgi:hypothetical protein